MTAILALAVLTIAAPTARAQEPPVRITMARSGCYGECPVYTVTMRGDGSVVYNGMAFVRVKGEQRWTVDPGAVLMLARDIEKAGFFEMQDRYTASVTDLPTTTITVTMGSRTKTVADHYGAPPELKEIEAWIDKVSRARDYIRLAAALIRQMQLRTWPATEVVE